jgi:hypothetical protein
MSVNPLNGPDWPAVQLRAVTPSDTVDLPAGPCRALYVGTTGDIAVIAKGDTAAVTLFSVPVGILPVSVTRVLVTGTTASAIVALY